MWHLTPLEMSKLSATCNSFLRSMCFILYRLWISTLLNKIASVKRVDFICFFVFTRRGDRRGSLDSKRQWEWRYKNVSYVGLASLRGWALSVLRAWVRETRRLKILAALCWIHIVMDISKNSDKDNQVNSFLQHIVARFEFPQSHLLMNQR